MKLRHKLTDDIQEISFHAWQTTISNKESYEIIERGDTVYMRQIENDGSRKYLYEIDRDHAIRIVKSNPNRFDFVELSATPFEIKAKLILGELKSQEERKGELTDILN